jgi:hypothetical protein
MAIDDELLPFYLIGLLLVWLVARIARKQGSARRSAGDRIFEGRGAASKKCPNCAEQLSLAALICDSCAYNFLSGMVGRGHKMLPAPEPDKIPENSLAS